MTTLNRAAALAAALCLAGLARPAVGAAAPVVLKIATLAPEGSTWLQMMDRLNTDLAARTGGAVSFKVYPGGVLGEDPDVVRKMRVGQIHGAGFTATGLCSIYPDLRVVTLPLMVRNASELAAAVGRLDQEVRRGFRDQGYELLGWTGMGFSYMFSTRTIGSIDELSRAKPWLWGNDPVMSGMYRAAGVSGVNLGLADVLTALQTGLVDTVFNTPTGLLGLQWFTRVKYMTDLPISPTLGGVVITARAWQSVPEEHRPVVQELVTTAITGLGARVREEDGQSVKTLAGQGITVLPPSAELLAGLERVAAATPDLMVGKDFSPAALERMRAVAAEIRAQAGAQ